MEREIGEQFYINEKLYEVIEEHSHSNCKGCAFAPNLCLIIKQQTGCCSSLFRSDNKGVIFKQIK